MAIPKKGITTYKRDKNKTEISGDPESVTELIKSDQRNAMIRWLVMIIITAAAIFLLPKGTLPVILKWVKHLLPFLSG